LFLFLSVTTLRDALSMGFDSTGTASSGCYLKSMTINGTFAATGAQYTARGTCYRTGSLGSTITFSWTANGTFSNNSAEETLVVPPALISQPSHPYGKWYTKYSCPSGDPWLTGAACAVITATGDSPVKDQNLQNQFSRARLERPITASLTQAQRNALAASRDSQFAAAAEAERRRAAQLMQGAAQSSATSYSGGFFPTVLLPKPKQIFFSQTSIAIKLAPPQSRSTTQINIDGSPIMTVWSVSSYTVYIQQKAANGAWTPHATIPIGGHDAQSAAGYMGWGSGGKDGKSLAFLATPGAWRLNAQATSPRQSGASDWVEFSVVVNPFGTSTSDKALPLVRGK